MPALTETRSTCPYCGVGCGVVIQSQGHAIVGVRGDEAHPANAGRLCTKGSTLHLTAAASLQSQVRALQPLWRTDRSQPLQPTDWDTALQHTVDRFDAVMQTHGADAVGVYASGQLLTEDYYLFNKLVKGLLGTNHLDTNSRLCMSSAVMGYKATLGADAPPCCYEDLALADTVVMAGSNTAWAHPILFRRLEDARRAKPDQRWIVIDPRRTETAEQADLHLQLLPGTDVALYHGLLHVLLWEGLVDRSFIADHTVGFDALQRRVQECTPAATARATGCSAEDIVQAARWFGQAPASLSLYCQGLNQSRQGSANNIALIHLHLATGQIGRPGAGPFSLTGQPNAMGGREVGGMATLLSGHRSLALPSDRAEVARLWNIDEVPAQPGRTAVELFEAAADGAVKALWIACTNPAQSMPRQSVVQAALQRAEFVVVQEAYRHTATTAYAHVLLPAASWGEKEGTVTNSERRISRVRAAVPPPGEARADWRIARDIAQRLRERMVARVSRRLPRFDYPDAESVWNEHRASTEGRDLDITGLSYAQLDTQGPQFWPFPAGATSGTERLYAQRRFAHADGRARFIDLAPQPPAEERSAAYPFSLNTGRLRDQWHGMSRTGTLARLQGHAPLPLLELHPQELQTLGVVEGEVVRLRSRRGELLVPVRAAPGVGLRQAFLPMHWGSEAWWGRQTDGQACSGVNALTVDARCPQSQQPELKHCAVQIAPVPTGWHLLARWRLPAEQLHAQRQRCREALDQLPLEGAWNASLLPWGREGEGTVMGLALRLDAERMLTATSLQALWQAWALEGPEVSTYEDPRRGRFRRLRLNAQGDRVWGMALAACGRLSTDWAALEALWAQDAPLPCAPGRLLLPGGAGMGLAPPVRSPQLCSCWNVDEAAALAVAGSAEGTASERVQRVQEALRCGTQCGSCLPRLRSLVQALPESSLPLTTEPTCPSQQP